MTAPFPGKPFTCTIYLLPPPPHFFLPLDFTLKLWIVWMWHSRWKLAKATELHTRVPHERGILPSLARNLAQVCQKFHECQWAWIWNMIQSQVTSGDFEALLYKYRICQTRTFLISISSVISCTYTFFFLCVLWYFKANSILIWTFIAVVFKHWQIGVCILNSSTVWTTVVWTCWYNLAEGRKSQERHGMSFFA